MDAADLPAGRARFRTAHQIVRLLARGRLPVVAAIEGACVGAGLALALCCDTIVAATDCSPGRGLRRDRAGGRFRPVAHAARPGRRGARPADPAVWRAGGPGSSPGHGIDRPPGRARRRHGRRPCPGADPGPRRPGAYRANKAVSVARARSRPGLGAGIRRARCSRLPTTWRGGRRSWPSARRCSGVSDQAGPLNLRPCGSTDWPWG